MLIREAVVADIPQLHVIRNSVTENVLSDPRLVTDAHYIDYLTRRGKGWVCEVNKTAVGFSIVSLADKNVWALFVLPEYKGKGIGKKLQHQMLQWYFTQTNETIWLSTETNSHAAQFYRRTGWMEVGWHNEQELKFEMTYADWKSVCDANNSTSSL